jgi:hypothetical protein
MKTDVCLYFVFLLFQKKKWNKKLKIYVKKLEKSWMGGHLHPSVRSAGSHTQREQISVGTFGCGPRHYC